MTRQIRSAVTGFVVGFGVAILGGLIAGNPIGIILLRSLIAGLIGGLLVFGLSALVAHFLPGLLPGPDTGSDSVAAETGQASETPSDPNRLDIVLPGDDEYIPNYQADQPAKSESAAQSAETAQSEPDNLSEPGAVLPGTEPTGQWTGEAAQPPSPQEFRETAPEFNEANFYSTIEKLPNFGEFSNQFTAGGPVAGSDNAPLSIDTLTQKSDASADKADTGGMDPSLVAQAIRTALKKE